VFEVDNGSTITTRGGRRVPLRKGGSSHKRFKAGFAIRAAGDMLKPCILFSKLVNRRQVPTGVVCYVNQTGMWNSEILWNCLKAVLLTRHPLPRVGSPKPIMISPLIMARPQRK
jgi:hypothetical protein